MGFISIRGRDSSLQIPLPPQGFLHGLNLSGVRANSWPPLSAGFAGVWFRHETPLRFRAGPAGADQARPARENRADEHTPAWS